MSRFRVLAIFAMLAVLVCGCDDESSQTLPDTDQTQPDADQTQPDADQTQSDADQTQPDEDQTQPDDDQTQPDEDQTQPDEDQEETELPIDPDYEFGVLGCFWKLTEVLAQVGWSIGENGNMSACPAIERTGTLIELDYGSGCDPFDNGQEELWSGAMSISLTLAARRFTVSFLTLVVDGDSLSGSMGGGYERGEGQVTLTTTLDLDFEPADCDIVGDLSVQLDNQEMSLDGTLEVGSVADLVIDSIAIENTSLASDCPMPYTGLFSYTDAELGVVQVEFDAQSPVDGTVKLTVKGFVFEDFDLCDAL